MEIILHLSKIKVKPVPKNDVFREFQVGDQININWKERCGKKDSYRPTGTIMQITSKLICYRCSAGYVCCVSDNQMASGVQVKIIKKGETAA